MPLHDYSSGISKPSKAAISHCSPIASMGKSAGVYWTDSRISQVSVSPPELMALVFSRQLLRPLQGTLIEAALNTAMSKMTAAIPQGATEYLQRLDQWFSVGLGPHKNYRQHCQAIDVLSHAIAHRHTVQMRYFSAGRNVTTRREVDPYRSRYVDGGLYLIAYCHWRKDVRMFR